MSKKKAPSRLDSSSSQKVPLIASGFIPYRFKEPKKVQRKARAKVTKSHRHHGGPVMQTIYTIKHSLLSPAPDRLYDDETVASWQPHMQLAVMSTNRQSGEARPLTAAEVQTRRQSPRWLPMYFANPMQDLDYLTIEQIKRTTITGPLIDSLTKFIVGKDFGPELELIEPSGNKEQDRAEIEKHQDIINDLKTLDELVSKTDGLTIDVHFKDKVAAAITNMNTFNRCALVFGYPENGTVEINGRKYKGLPNSIKVAHPRDLGMVKVNPETWRLESVQWRNAYYMIPARDMIYLWNPLISATTHNSWLYGDSLVLPMLDAARTIRKNIAVNFPAMGEVAWAGSAIEFIKPKGQTPADKEQEYSDIVNNFVRGTINVQLEDPQEVKVERLDFNPQVDKFMHLTEFLVKYCVADVGLPHSLFFDEDSSNRSTMLGKIQMAISVTINPFREIPGRALAEQWYGRWFKLICEQSGRQELLKKFRVKTVWSDLHIEEWGDRIDAVNKVDQRKQLTDEAYGELAGIENYPQKTEPDAEVTPGGKGNQFEFDDGNGGGFEVKEKGKSGSSGRRPMKAKEDPGLTALRKQAYSRIIELSKEK